uniref:Uncharacterized protein n=1 Tax=Pithovirus LCDPAC01 TaxID=2506600 RepID=A0A481YP79_9VIRU|nr:MAG: uncharacterized protein LCDPAC01_00930 [Pithovirus LCDPAC01]
MSATPKVEDKYNSDDSQYYIFQNVIQPSKRRKPTVIEERLNSLDISEHIKQGCFIALADFRKKHHISSFKVKSQNEIIYSCVWKAYYDNNVVVDPKFVLKLLEFKNKDISTDQASNKYLADIRPKPSDFVAFYIDRYISLCEEAKHTFGYERSDIINAAVNFIDKITVEISTNKQVTDWLQSNMLTNTVIGMLSFYIIKLLRNKSWRNDLWSKSCYLTRICIKTHMDNFELNYNSAL